MIQVLKDLGGVPSLTFCWLSGSTDLTPKVFLPRYNKNLITKPISLRFGPHSYTLKFGDTFNHLLELPASQSIQHCEIIPPYLFFI